MIMNSSIAQRIRSLSFYAKSIKAGEQSVSVKLNDGPSLELKTGHVARFTSGAVVASCGGNAILATCVANKSKPGTLVVDYKQSAAAVGRIPTNFLRRELSQSDHEILLSRAIDRSLRPLLPAECCEVQVVCKPLVLDENGDQLVLGLNAASMALQLSEVDFDGPLATCRIVSDENSNIMINPNRQQCSKSHLNMIVAMKKGQRTEKKSKYKFFSSKFSMETIEKALDVGFERVEHLLIAMEGLAADRKPVKAKLRSVSGERTIGQAVENLARERLYYVFTNITHDKTSRDNEIKEILEDVLSSSDVEGMLCEVVQETFYKLGKKIMREIVQESNTRCDGRRLEDFRPINIDIDMYPMLHGCSLFQRGQTQVMSTVTFDSPSAAFHPDSVAQLLGSQRKKSFMLHYEFPGYAVNEISTSRAANRREIGHGALAEKALKNVFPDDFPYAVRLACQVLESNGSSSMASVCAGSLALMDAGVPLKAPAAGVAIGLLTDPTSPDENYRVLTDIMGYEDYAGDMDFKIAGTSKGFTAIQLDMKIPGMTRKQLSEAMAAGQKGVDFVLNKMNAVRSKPREEFKSTVPVFEHLKMEPFRRANLFRNGAYNAKMIETATDVKISSDEENMVLLLAPNKEKLEAAKEMINKLTIDTSNVQYSFGQFLNVEIAEVLNKGVQVVLPGGSQKVFVSNGQLSATAISHPSALGMKVGDKITVQWFGRDELTGTIRLSRRTLAGSNLRSTALKKT
ncbi:unnamed protein product [Caenorhabditis auriculariae]|uniref:polyribonucleotide nucleotidyltransferase n=1 Tax=Caenorhabditis auriculariae TaxID=2777116 RepID=A0A8S1HN72_9PELO|nr:unnamed protein product [Caenorhabditis auriculariae]